MPGPGPPPKEPHRRTGHRKDPNPTTRLPFKPCTPPDLPEDCEFDWHPQTRAWWKVWQESPQATMMSETDWSYMLDTALMHHHMWGRQQWTLAAEVRIRLAQFGATPADRLRLRIQWADADNKDLPAAAPVPERKSKYGELKALPPQKDAG